jgi:serine/threonine-protein kinase
MAPEQATGETDLDHRVDVYSVGVILYEMLAGKLPFGGTSPGMVIARVMLGSAKPLSGIRPELPNLGAVAHRALERDRDARFVTARAMRRAVQSAAMEDLGIEREMWSGRIKLPTPTESMTAADSERADAVTQSGEAAALLPDATDPFSEFPPAPPVKSTGRWVVFALAMAVVGGAVALLLPSDAETAEPTVADAPRPTTRLAEATAGTVDPARVVDMVQSPEPELPSRETETETETEVDSSHRVVMRRSEMAETETDTMTADTMAADTMAADTMAAATMAETGMTTETETETGLMTDVSMSGVVRELDF